MVGCSRANQGVTSFQGVDRLAVLGFVLGFMLGSAGAFGKIMGIPFDIRHIAFGSSHAALALWHSSALVTWQSALILMVAVSIIGLVNFLVSFSLTLGVAVNARRLEGVNWQRQLGSLWQLAKTQPLSFFLPRDTAAAAPASESIDQSASQHHGS